MSPRRGGRPTGFPATLRGWCDECDYRIEIDEMITGADYGHGRYRHVNCPEVASEKPTRFVGSTDEEMGFG